MKWVLYSLFILSCSTGSGKSACVNHYELWASSQISHCTGASAYSVIDYVMQMTGACNCLGAHLHFSTTVSYGSGASGIDGIDGANSVAASADGNHLYVAGFLDDALALFQRDQSTGELVFIEAYRDGVNGVDDLWGARSVALSGDDNQVYVAGFYDHALTVFQRSTTTGRLTLLEAHRDGVNGVDGLDGANQVVVSPDDNHVYVTGLNDNSVAVFSRDATTGALAYVEVQRDGVSGVDGLDGAYSLTLSPDGSQLFATGIYDDAMAVFTRDTTTGVLTFQEVHLSSTSGLDAPYSVTISPAGDHLYVAGLISDSLALYERDTAMGTVTYVESYQDDVSGVSGLDAPWAVTVSADGYNVYTAAYFDDAIAVFQRDQTSGVLTFVEAQSDGVSGVNGLDGARSLGLSTDDNFLYAGGYLDGAVATFQRNQGAGLVFVDAQVDGSYDVDGFNGASSVMVSPDNAHLYATGLGNDSLVVFERDATTGLLTYVETQSNDETGVLGLSGVRSLALCSDGEHLYAAGYHDDALTVFQRDATTGALTFVELQQDGVSGVDGLDGARSIALDSGGSHLYVTGFYDHALAVFQRDATSGALTFVEVHQDGFSGVDGLDGAWSVTLSSDDSHVYATGFEDDALAVFQRDQTTGTLTFVEVVRDGVNGVDGLDGTRSVRVSADGLHVYASGFYDDALAVFQRDQTTGSLTFVEVLRDGVNGIAGLAGAWSLGVNSADTYLYAIGYGDQAVTVFGRDGTTGTLTQAEIHQNGVAGVSGLSRAMSVAVSPDSGYLYILGQDGLSLAVFTVL